MSEIAAAPDLAARMALQWEVQNFYFEEARMLDERRFNDWLALFSVHATYRAPVRVTREDVNDLGVGDLCIFDDEYGELEVRVAGLQVRSAWAEIPPSRTRRTISNVIAEPHPEAPDDILGRSNFLIYRTRLESVEHFFSGARTDTLRRVGDTFQIRAREILFDNVAFQTDNISLMF